MADFIVTSLQPWNVKIGSDSRNLALELAKQNRVLYVNPPTDIASRIRNMLGGG